MRPQPVRPLGRDILLIVGALLLSPLRVPLCWALPGDSERAELLVRQGMMLLEAGSPSAAREYASRALEFEAEAADALALLGEVAVSEGRYDQAVRDFQSALRAARFRVAREDAVRRSLAAALLRMRRPRDAQDALDGLLPEQVDAAALILASRAARDQGNLERAGSLAREAAARFPDDPQAYLLLASIERALNRFGEARSVLEAARLRLPADPSVLLELAREQSSGEARKALLESYFALPDRPRAGDVTAALELMRVDAPASGEHVERFLASGGAGSAEAVAEARVDLAALPDALARLEAALAAWSGERGGDADGDSFPDYRYRIVSGRLVEWGADPDQDGLEEIVVESGASGAAVTVVFSDWTPAPAYGADSTQYVRVRYSAYPWVASVELGAGERRRVYELVPRQLSLPIVEPGRPADQPAPLADVGPPSEGRVRSLSSAVRDYLMPADLLASTRFLLSGSVLRLEEDVDGNGRTDHVVLYRDDQAISGRRDLDGDGDFEVSEHYAEGALRGLEIDQDGDGKAEYVREFGEDARELWDLDADGSMDLERSRGLVRELTDAYRASREAAP